MKIKIANILLAAILAFFIIIAFYVYEINKKEKTIGFFLDKNSNSIRSLRLVPKKGEEILLVNQEQNWKILKPIEDLADQTRVAKLLSLVQNIKKEKVVSKSVEDLQPFGLNPCVARIILETNSGYQQIQFGRFTLDERGIFIHFLSEKGTVFIANAQIYRDIFVHANVLREKRLLPLIKSEIDKLYLRVGRIEVEFWKNGEQWEGHKKTLLPTNFENVNEIINNLQRLIIFDFINSKNNDLQNYGLLLPFIQIRLTGSLGEYALTFGDETTEGFVYSKVTWRPGIIIVEKPMIYSFYKQFSK